MNNGSGNGAGDGQLDIRHSRRAENLPLVQVMANTSFAMNMHAQSLWEMARQLSVLAEPVHPVFVAQLADKIGEAKETLAAAERDVRARVDVDA